MLKLKSFLKSKEVQKTKAIMVNKYIEKEEENFKIQKLKLKMMKGLS